MDVLHISFINIQMKMHEIQREHGRQIAEINQRQEICKRARNEMVIVKEVSTYVRYPNNQRISSASTTSVQPNDILA